MTSPPAHCQSCDAFFFSTMMRFENARGISFTNTRVQCPKCGAMAQILDGTYDFVDNAIHLLAGPATTAATLRQIAALLEAARTRGDTREELRSTLATHGDAIGSLGDLLPSGRAELYAFVAMVLALIQLLLQAAQPSGSVTVEQVFNTVVEQHQSSSQSPKPGRNDPCHCGSGKKYKHCHLGKE